MLYVRKVINNNDTFLKRLHFMRHLTKNKIDIKNVNNDT